MWLTKSPNLGNEKSKPGSYSLSVKGAIAVARCDFSEDLRQKFRALYPILWRHFRNTLTNAKLQKFWW